MALIQQPIYWSQMVRNGERNSLPPFSLRDGYYRSNILMLYIDIGFCVKNSSFIFKRAQEFWSHTL